MPSVGEQLAEQRADFAFGAGAIGLRERLEVEAIEQLAMNVRLQFQILLSRRHRRPDRRG